MASSRPLEDSPSRSYAGKLERFSRFVEPELRELFSGLKLAPGARVLDVGCGVGIATNLFAELLGSEARVVGIDLSRPHLRAARDSRAINVARNPRAMIVARTRRAVNLVQADASQLCFRDGTFDLIWCCNTINHLADPLAAVRSMRALLRPSGRLVLAQSGFLPEMFFAWDAALDEAVRRACHSYYRDRYALAADRTARLRGLVGLVQGAAMHLGHVRTVVIERLQPLTDADRDYFEETIFRGTWGDRLKPYLSPGEWQALCHNIDPASGGYCLDREDFHHLQTLTLCEAYV